MPYICPEFFRAFFMINHNGVLVTSDFILANNRSFLYGDGVFETLKIVDSKILFFESHYFRLMSSMRILRMKIPMQFTMEFLEQEVLNLAKESGLTSCRIRFTVYRNDGGYYTPKDSTISYVIQASPIAEKLYQSTNTSFEVELFKDFHVSNHLLSTLKTTSKTIHVLAAIFAQENGYHSCLMINESKNVTEGVSGNLFIRFGTTITTPPLSEGCLNGVMRKQVMQLIEKNDELELVEAPISPFDLQKADELFLTNVIQGIQSITKYRKKTYETTVGSLLIEQLNASIPVS
ncbi:aminotransferase class IV [Flavobacterium orientale]|uniref:branched-chain-amino-acid transaminase n=1 Tax=Flavobacterium orientale TaxID=1756020 RepID=A0A917DE90_9FLAO|nr:aminotransferase class IV [Flavobacterium orientale]GGD29829.1 aminotransferase class IV [Flavobacterium orientale]